MASASSAGFRSGPSPKTGEIYPYPSIPVKQSATGADSAFEGMDADYSIDELLGSMLGWDASDLAVAAAAKLLADQGLDIAGVDLLVFASASQDMIEPATAHIVAARMIWNAVLLRRWKPNAMGGVSSIEATTSPTTMPLRISGLGSISEPCGM